MVPLSSFSFLVYLYFPVFRFILLSAEFSEELSSLELENYFLSEPSDEIDYNYKGGNTYYEKSDSKSSEDEYKGRNRNIWTMLYRSNKMLSLKYMLISRN